MLLAALSDKWIIGLTVGQWLVNGAMAVALWWVSRRTQRIEALESEVTARAEQRVEEHLQSVNKRLEWGEKRFDSLQERDQRIELRLAQSLGEIKELIRKECATKDSMNRVFERIDSLGQALAEKEDRS